MRVPAAWLCTIETVVAPYNRLSNSISCLKKPVFGRIEGRLDLKWMKAFRRDILSCLMRYARHREAERLTPATQCTSVLPPADRTCRQATLYHLPNYADKGVLLLDRFFKTKTSIMNIVRVSPFNNLERI